MVNGFPDVMQKPGSFCHPHVKPDFPGKKPCQLCNFHGMLERILAIACSEFHPPEKPYQLRMDSVNANLQRSRLSFFPDQRLHFLAGFLHHLLNPRGMDTAIHDELFKGDPRNLASDRVKSRQDYGFRRIVNNKLNACHSLQCPDVASFPAYDPSFHLIARKLNHRNRRLGHVVCSASLNCSHDALFRTLVCLFLRLSLQLFH